MDERRDKSRTRSADADRASREAKGEPTPAREAGSFGAWLRAQRVARSVSIDAIAEGSKISRRYLEALETDRFDALPAPVFVRGFLREYARIVGLDPDEVVNFYLLARPSTVRERAGGAATAPPRDRPTARRSARRLGWGLLLAAVLLTLAAVAAAVSWWAGSRGAERESPARPSRPAAVAAEQATEAPTPASPPAPADSEPTRAAAASPPERASEAPPAPAASPPGPLVADAMLAPAPPAVEEELRVVLEFRQDCWVDVVVDGRRRESELKAGGETLALEASEYVLLTLGNGPAVRVEVNGEPFALPEQGARVVRDLRIDRAVVAAARRPPGEPLRR